MTLKRNGAHRLMGMVVGVACIACIARPADASLFMPGTDTQKKAGANAAAQIAKQYRLVGGERQARFENVALKLLSALPKGDRTRWDWHFHVIASKDVNAFALPGGNVYIFTGLLDRIKTADELAGVTGHEMTHVRKEHWAHQVADQHKRQLGLGLLLGAAHAGNAAYDVAGLADSLVDLRYSRKDEDAADEGGLENMVAAGYDPNGMLRLFDTLQKAAGDGKSPSFLRDHPLTSDRIEHTKQRIAEMQSPGKTGR